MRRIAIGLCALVICALPAGHANAQTTLVGNLYGYRLCRGQYALCESSICTPTGGTIEVNVAGGGTASFPAATCTCPIRNGLSIADVQGGNMQGSCEAPGKGQVWSLYAPLTSLPQEINNWSKKPAAKAVDIQLCSSSLNLGNQFANCFSFSCTIDNKLTNGVKTATCTCPLGENPDGSAVTASTAFTTPAGQCNSSVCADHPVGAAYAGADSQANECLVDNGSSSSNAEDLMAQ